MPTLNHSHVLTENEMVCFFACFFLSFFLFSVTCLGDCYFEKAKEDAPVATVGREMAKTKKSAEV